jgi:hypothetical protein
MPCPRRPASRLTLAVAVGALALGVAACGGSQEAAAPAEPAPTPVPREAKPEAPEAAPSRPEALAPGVVQQLVQDAVRTDGSLSLSDVVERLGAPRRVEREPVENQFQPGVTDTLVTAVYPGLVAQLYAVTRERKTFLIRLTITDRRYPSPEGLRVGDPRTAVVERIGPPTQIDHGRQAERMVYIETSTMPTGLVVTVEDGRVTALEWQFYFS